ncbi:MAG: hypothetical protein Q9211_005498 [Gyalolechia sp. 1 TL-2023]
MTAAIPVIVCGQTPSIAQSVIAGLRPEIEVVHTVLSPAQGVAEIPVLLRGNAPSNNTNNLGTKNYSKPPQAVILGAAFGVHLSEMRAACKGDSKVPWLELDQSKSAPRIGFGYGAALVERVKSTIAELEKEGKMGNDGVYFY